MLKKIITTLLFTVYSIIIFKDFLPMFIYRTNLDYIIEYLCEQKEEEENLCMGHCYLNKKAQSQAEENNKPPLQNINSKNLELHFCADKNSSADYSNLITDNEKYTNLLFPILTNAIKPLIPPPKFCFS